MKVIKKFTTFLLMLILCISMLEIPVFAASSMQDGLEVTLNTDKETYSQGEQIVATLTVTNTNEVAVSNVSLENVIPEGYKLADGFEATKQVESLAAGENVILTVTYIEDSTNGEEIDPGSGDTSGSGANSGFETGNQPGTDGNNTGTGNNSNSNSLSSTNSNQSNSEKTDSVAKTGDNASIVLWSVLLVLACSGIVILIVLKKKSGKHLLSLLLCVTMAASLVTTISIKAYAEENNTSSINIENIIIVDGEEITLTSIVNYDRLYAVDDTITLNSFSADIYDIYLDTETTVTFTVEVNPSTLIPDKSLAVYDDCNQFIVYMNDDGVNGDQIANDSIYTGQAILSSSEIKLVNYFASIGKVKSNSFEICYYRDLTQEEFVAFTKLLNTISELSFDDACEYVKSSEEIKVYFIDNENKTITYQSIYGIYGIWEEHSDLSIKGNGENAIPVENGRDYSAVDRVISSATIVSEINNKDVIVLRPFRNSEFMYDDFKTTGELMAKALGENLTVIDDGDVTISVMKSLASYGTVLVDSHGTLNFFGTPYMLIGEELNEDKFLWDPVYYLQHVSYSADYLSGRIYCTGYYDRLAIGGKFFEKYYSSDLLNDSYWFLGTCYSMYDDSIANALTNKGASAVIGFTDTVSVGYCNDTLFETTLNSMLLSADTVGNSVKCAKDIYGAVDPNNSRCELKLKGNNNFKLVTSISTEAGSLSGKICKASDHITPVGGATISVYKDNSLMRTLTADDVGNYTINLPVGEYRIEIAASGYITFNGYATVTENSNTYIETFLMVEGSEDAENVLEFGNHKYKFYNNSMTWEEAKDFCESQGGYLAVINSAEENAAISQFLTENDSKNCYWIGVYSDGIEQEWKSVTGEVVEYTNWSSGEPNNQEGQEMFVHIYGKQDPSNSENGIGEWNDASVNGASYAGEFYNLDNFGFICEYGSEDEKNVLEFDGHQYKLYNENSMTWEQANAFCEEQGGHLVTITSADEQDAIYQYAKQFDVHSDIWIGISDAEVEGDWSHWITGEEVTFTNWGTGEPDNYQGIEQDYGVICMEHKSGSGYDVQPGQWDDIAENGETASGFFICEWE